MSDIWKKTFGVTFLMCAVAVLFPPRGFYGSFDKFGFILSDVKLSDSPGIRADISWGILGGEIMAILFVGLAVGFLLSSRQS